MAFAFREVEAILQHMNQIGGSGIAAFRARLKHLQKLGFPAGMNTGKGKAADYQPVHVVMLALAVDLLQLGLSPERVVRMMAENKFNFAQALRRASLALQTGFHQDLADIFIFFDPCTLDYLTDHVITGNDIAISSFNYAESGDLKDNLESWTGDMGVFRRLSLINLSTALRESANYFGKMGTMKKSEYFKSLSDWSDIVTRLGAELGDDPQA